MKELATAINNFLSSNQLLIGVLGGWLFTRLMEVIRTPVLSFEPSNDVEFSRDTKKFKFINIVVSNKKQTRIAKFFRGNASLNNARAWIIFRDFSSQAEILKINGRWATNKEPIDYNSGQLVLSEILIPSRETIPTGEEATITIAIKEQGEDLVFAFNNESYRHNWKYLDYELPERKYIVEIQLLADGNEYNPKFLLQNPSKSLKNFKIIRI